ncbi:MAG TPA: LacI family DNA-binding transcriptional regulator [Ktedonobacteraceae bacterium]|nr:LacI family DNA-binding transcriptional regulator [Ktedonobacteraceae bacterium]
MVTSEQVAQLAGVSRATVSRVLNGSPRISDEARERVHNAIKTLGYEPNIVAQNLARPRSRMIALSLFHENEGLAISQLGRTENYFYIDMIQHIDRSVAAIGYDLFMPSLPRSKPESYIRSIRARRAAGIIMLAIDQSDPRIQALIEAKIPTVFVDTMGEGSHATYAQSNHLEGASQIAEHLLALGHRRIAFLIEPLSNPTSTERLLGCQQVMARAGIPFDPGLLCQVEWSTDEAYQAARVFLSRRRDFTAIVAGSDMMAIGILRALHEAGLRVPEDVSLTGFDDVVLSQYTTPPLTTIRQDKEALGSGAVQRLIALIEEEGNVSPLIVPSQLVVRASTGPAPALA